MNKIIALAGNPNVGKSTVFNELTGLKQHTGNWAGKTVENASGKCTYKDIEYTIFDLPGTYSLISHSKEEEVARDFICLEDYDNIIVVCDAVCLERNLNLVLQILEITNHVTVCVNLIDEAKKKKIEIDIKRLENILNVPVIPTSARNKEGLDDLLEKVATYKKTNPFQVTYEDDIETAIETVKTLISDKEKDISSRFFAIKLLCYDSRENSRLNEYLENKFLSNPFIKQCVIELKSYLLEKGISNELLEEKIASKIVNIAEDISKEVVVFHNQKYAEKDRKIDRILTSKKTGIPIMILFLMFIFWLTIVGSNYPSSILFDILFWFEDKIQFALEWLHFPEWTVNLLVFGVYRVLAWVVAVMLPPMAIFFPLFTLLEDLGYLPRIAFNLDKYFKKCNACGKQALSMCMSFGCNSVGIVGTRIIDSARERLLAILTNNFIPCNGRFPTIITIISMFFIGNELGLFSSLLNVLILISLVLFSILMSFIISKILTKTILKGVPSSFTLELPPYRRPQVGKVIVRSILDRTLFVLGRAIIIAIPAGILIWVLANIQIDNISLLMHIANFLDPFAYYIGLDGVILLAFILGFPANEIVIPIIIMAYMATGKITDFNNIFELKKLLLENGWTSLTAICTILFSLMHFPCSTTCLTIKKETGSMKWTVLSFLIPTVTGIIICFLVAMITRLIF